MRRRQGTFVFALSGAPSSRRRNSGSRRCGARKATFASEGIPALHLAARRTDGEASNDRSLFRADGWIESNAGVQALALVDDQDFWRVADVAALPFDRPAALSAIGTSQARLSIADTRWLAQFVPVAKAVLAGDAGPS